MKIIGKILKTLGWILLSVLLLIIAVSILIQVPAVQNYLKDRAVKYVENKIHTKVSIGHISLKLFSSLEIQKIYLEDQKKDTLLYAQRFRVDMAMLQLLRGRAQVKGIVLEGVNANVLRLAPDTVFNYQYIVNAFAGTDTTVKKDSTPSNFSLDLETLELDNIRAHYKDDVVGMNAALCIGHLKTGLRRFDMQTMNIDIPGIRFADAALDIHQYRPLVHLRSDSLAKAQTAKDTAAIHMPFRLGEVDFSNIRFRYKDDIGNMLADIQLGKLFVDPGKTDLSKMFFALKDLQLERTKATIVMGKPAEPAKKDTSAPLNWRFMVSKASLNGIDFRYDDLTQRPIKKGMDYAHLYFRNVLVEGKNIDLTPTQYTGEITRGALSEKGGLTVNRLQARFKYNDHGASLGKLLLQTPHSLIRDSLNVKYASLDAIAKNPGDLYLYAHLSSNTIYAGDILAAAPMMQQYMEGYANRYFYLNTTVKGTVKNLSIPSLEMRGLDNTYLKMSGGIRGLPDAEKAYFNLKVDRLTTSIGDIKKLVPAGMMPMDLSPYDKGLLSLRTTVKGSMSNLSIPVFELRGLQNTDISLSGRTTGLPNMNRAWFDLKLNRLHTTARDIATLAPKGTIPYDKVRIPNAISASGYFRGGLSALSTRFNVYTSNGRADLTATLNQKGIYNAHLLLSDFNAGYILRMDSMMGKMSLTADAHGSGLNFNRFRLNRLVSNYKARVIYADIYGYRYRDFIADGNLRNGIINTTAAIRDSNLLFNMHAVADIKPQYPTLQATIELDTINFMALHLTDQPMGMRAGIKADFVSTNPDRLNGTLTLHNFALKSDSLNLRLDSLYFLSRQHDTTGHMELAADSIFHMELNGNYRPTEMATALQNTIHKYYTLPGYTPKKVLPQNWDMNGYLLSQKIVTQYLPELRGSDSLVFSGGLNTRDSSFQLLVHCDSLIYAPQRIDNFNIRVVTENDSLRLTAGAREIKTNTYHLFGTGIRATAIHNMLDFGIGTLDSTRKTWYGLGGTVEQLKNAYWLRLKPEGLVLNYDHWSVDTGNVLIYDGKKGIFAHNFILSTKGQELSLNSPSDTANSPIDIAFKNFQLSTIMHAANQTGMQVEGILNGTAQVRNIMGKQIMFVSDLKGDSLRYGGYAVGNLAMKVKNENADIYNADISLLGNQNDLRLAGNYNMAINGLDFKLDIKQFNLATIKPFSFGQLDSIGGLMAASAVIGGTVDTPTVNGNLHFDSAFLTPAITGAMLHLPNETVGIDQNGLHFNRFTVRDARNNRLRIDGDLLTKNFLDYGFNLTLRANDFMLINTPKGDDRFFYGKLAFNANMKIGGDMQSPVVSGTVKANKETDFSLIMPSDDPEVEDRKGVVVFVDKNHRSDTTRVRLLSDSLSRNAKIKGMDINLNIEADTSAKFALIIDERTGDALNISGDADLVFGIDPSSKMTLTGKYTLTQGGYQLTMGPIHKKFSIQRGSYINWTGDPLSAIADITALYEIKTSAADLMSQQVSGSDLTQYKQNMPFSVALKLKNQLMKPDISFDITLPSDYLSQYPLVDTKLQQIRTDQAETNKQVFALLLLGRFVGENPLQSAGAAMDAGDMARQTASRLLTSQLNQLAANLVQGVDLNFDLNSGTDYSTGTAQQQTDLNVGVSKRLFDDRIQVSVGSNFALEGANANQQATNIAGDVSVDYKMSRDGRYMLRAYRKNQYEGVVEGQVVRTGVGFVFTLDYDRFKEIFEKPRNRQRRARRQNTGTRTNKNQEKNAAGKDIKKNDPGQNP